MKVRCPRMGCKCWIPDAEDQTKRVANMGVHFAIVHRILLSFEIAKTITSWAENIEKQRQNPQIVPKDPDRKEENMT
jgi:hypothetical protein